MWQRWIRLKEARQALKAGRYEDAYRLSQDRSVAEHRQAIDVRDSAVRSILDRARRLRDLGEMSQAFEDVCFLRGAGERSEDAVLLEKELKRALDDKRAAERRSRQVLDAARRKVRSGDLATARELLSSASPDDPEAARLFAEIDTRRQEAERLRGDIDTALASGRADEAERMWRRLSTVDPHGSELDPIERRVRQARTEAAVQRASRALSANQLFEAREALAEARTLAAADDAMSAKEIPTLGRKLAAAAEKAVKNAIHEGRLPEARRHLGLLTESPEGADAARGLTSGLDAVGRAQTLRDTGCLTEAIEVLRVAQSSLPSSKAIDAMVREITKTQKSVEKLLAQSSDKVKKGDPRGAFEDLEEVLALVPGHRAALSQRRFLEEAMKADSERLGRAEAGLASGRLEEARVLCLTAGSSPHADTARANEILARVEKLREATREAMIDAERLLAGSEVLDPQLRQVQSRLDRMAAKHCDSEELEELRQRVTRELTVREALRRAGDVESRGEPAEAVRIFRAALAEVDDPRLRLELDRLMGPAVRDGITRAERHIAARQFESARALLEEQVGEAIPGSPEALRIQDLLAQIRSSRESAAQVESHIDRALRAGDYESAESQLEKLQRETPEHDTLGALQRRLESGRAVESAMTARADRPATSNGSARASGDRPDGQDLRRHLDELKSSPKDRSMLFHLKKRVGRKTGVTGDSFLLCVEEGGEYLVLTKDLVTIGNIKSKNADVRILANLAAQHAVIERSFSFHSGVSYHLKCQHGRKCTVNGRPFSEGRLQSGDRIELDHGFWMRFDIPTDRSGTARLTLAPGFGMEGVEHILLMKDDGPDGRVILANTERSHVTIPQLLKEIEIYRSQSGALSGELVCRSMAGVEVDGEGGRAEERLYPGCLVRCADLRFSIETSA